MAIAIAMIVMSTIIPCRTIGLMVVLVYIDITGQYWKNAAIKYPYAGCGSTQDRCNLGIINATGAIDM